MKIIEDREVAKGYIVIVSGLPYNVMADYYVSEGGVTTFYSGNSVDSIRTAEFKASKIDGIIEVIYAN